MSKETYLDSFGNVIKLKWVKAKNHPDIHINATDMMEANRVKSIIKKARKQVEEEKKKAEADTSAGNQTQD